MIDFVNEKFNYHKKFLTRRCIKMTNNIRKIKQDLRAYAKRCKDVHYTESLVITFLITGMLFATSNLFSAPTNTSIENQRQTISTSIKTIHQQVKATRKENDKLLKNTNLELIQLMEQGDHVVKSPWSSWQYGINYFNNNWNGTYKGRGDKKAKYPYEGILERDTNEFNRYMPTNSENYGLLGKSKGARSAATNARQGLPIGYGIASNIPVPEPPVSTIVNAGINPRNINKSPLNLTPKVANSPTLPEPVKFSPLSPDITLPADPALPVPPTFAIVLGADCNEGCNSSDWRHGYTNATPRKISKSDIISNTQSNQNITTWLHYTWRDGLVTPAEKSYAFKMFAETNTTNISNPAAGGNNAPSGNEFYFNSYNFGGEVEFAGGVLDSQEVELTGNPADDKNHQYFFIGGSRFWEIDNQTSEVTYDFPNGKILNLGGILTLGMVSQENAATLKNSGVITDSKEKEDSWIQNMPQDLSIRGATTNYTIHRSNKGYVGYKVGIAEVEENRYGTGDWKNGDKQVLTNSGTGKINFFGTRSIGMYVYLPTSKNFAIMSNEGEINLHGKESYGMKIAANSDDRATMVNAQGASITLGNNNGNNNPNEYNEDQADNSAAMTLMVDSSVTNGVTLKRGNARNEGTINLTNVKNSIGAYVNIDSNITNTKDIKINSNITKATSGSQPVNIGMRADNLNGPNGTVGNVGGAEVINTDTGKITIDGGYAIGMLASGKSNNKSSILKNQGKITSTNIKHGIGIVGIDNAKVENSGEIKVLGTGDTNNIGIYLKNSTGEVGTKGTVTPYTEVSGDNSIGVLASNSNLTMEGNVKVSGNSVLGIFAGQKEVTPPTTPPTYTGKSEITLNGNATVTVNNNGAVAGANNNKGSYGIVVKGENSKFTGVDTNVDAKVTTDKSIGLYSEGTLTVNKANVTATAGAINFFAANGGDIITKGGTTETGQKSLLFYTSDNGSNKGTIKINGAMTSTIKGATGANAASNRGTAFYYTAPGATYGTFNTAAIQNYFDNTFGTGASGSSTLGNLTLNMEEGSRLFVASNVEMNLSDTSATSLTSGLTGAPTINALGNYKTFMLYLSKLNINQAVDLNDVNNPYNQLEIANSSIENANNMTGSQNKQVAMAQENGNDTLGNGYEASKVKLVNETSGVINLTGEETTGIYAKRGIVENKGNISVGKKSTAIYVVEDDRGPTGRQSTTASNEAGGIIKLGENSTGIYYKVDSAGANTNEAGGIINAGTIESSSNDVIAMSYDNPHSNSRVFKNESTGLIDLKGQKSTAMYATGGGTYSVTNDGTIKLANSDNANSPNIGMYTDKSQITFNNDGTIEGGNKTVGIYGYGVNLGNTSTVKAGEGATGVYSKGGNVNIGGTLTVGTNDAVGVYYVGSDGAITNNANTVNIGDKSYGFVIQGQSNTPSTFTSNTSNVNVGSGTVYAYSNDKRRTITNGTALTSAGSENYGIYADGTVVNNANINFGSGIGNVGIYSIDSSNGNSANATNNATITVGSTDAANQKFSIGMAAGYGTSGSGTVTNNGTINVNGAGGSIGMYGTGANTRVVNGATGTINLGANEAIGMYLDNGATGENFGKITTTGAGAHSKVTGIVVSNKSKFINHPGGKVHIDSPEGFGIYRVNNGEPGENTSLVVYNYGDITIGSGARADGKYDPTGGKPLEKTAGSINLSVPKGASEATITVHGKPVPSSSVVKVDTPFGQREATLVSSLGMYVDTLRGTNPINGLNNLLGVKKAELLYGIDAADKSNSKYFEVSGRILKPYQDAIRKAGKSIEWKHNSASFTWTAIPTIGSDGIPEKVYMAKIPYTDFAGKAATPVNSTDTYNFLDGLEQRYGVNALDSREKLLFNKLNHIGNNEETLFYQATDEMMGHQYGNLQQRINATGNLLDKEFRYLKHDWRNPSKQNNKIKVFGMRDEYNTDTAGIINYTSNAYGVAYVHEDEKIKMGNSSGWYAGAVTNRFKFKDIGKSKENQTILKAGVFKTMSPKKDYNGALQWTIGGDVFVGINDMKRRYLVVDEVFQAKSDYHSYGAALKTDLGYDVRLSERTHFRPYGALKMEYGKFNDIKEDRGEMRLEVKGNDYFSVKPEVGMEFKYVQPLAVRTNLTVGLTAAYENELGKVGDVNNRGRVRYTTADWFGIRGEKDDRKGNGKFDLNIGVDNTRFGVTVNGGYDTKGKNVRAGIGFRAIY